MGSRTTKNTSKKRIIVNYDRLFEENCHYQPQSKDIIALKDFFIKKQGWIYIAHSKNNNLLKIGRTGKNPLERAKSLSSTGVLYDYKILFSLKVFNQFWVEKKVHQKLKKFRISKEFFSVKEDLAIEIIQQIYEEEIKLLNRFFDTTMLNEDINLLEVAIKKYSHQ